MAKSFAFSLCFSLLLMALSPISYADIRWSSKANDDGVPAQELWCVAKNNADDAALQTALNWACGAGGADCSPIQQGGPCYDPSNIQNTASYAFNDYFLKHGLTDDSCNFDNNAAVTALNPSYRNCKFPSSRTVSNGGNFSGSTTSSSSSVGLGPNEDVSGCSKVARKWFWPLIANHLLFMVVSRVVSG
ncbi:hypothetical protein L6164_018625 [Bauhinia variegata]|uniref:Uncharacterized protein n=1 Tax=Bauhinia variegata TaxID=167791 RepID=A0ACB9NCE7_BAUVA|nr:hypothetical protein L6164_018625 [Bauhinia variegata]